MPAPLNLNTPLNLNAPLKPLAAVFCFALLAGGSVAAAPPPPPAPAAAAPDYGGRDSALPAVGEAAPDPAASAGRTLEALAIVLAGVAGTVYVLKRFNLVKPGGGGKPARIAGSMFGRPAAGSAEEVRVVSSQALPGGAMLHVVQAGGRTLLLGATAQSVRAISEWDTPPAAALSAEAALSEGFEDYLSRAEPDRPDSGSSIAAANARLRSLLSPHSSEEPS